MLNLLGQGNATILVVASSKDKDSLKNLLEWELFRLEDLSAETPLEFPEGSTLAPRISKEGKITVKSLAAFLKDKPKLTKDEKQELLGVLRLANTKGRIEFSDSESAYKTLISEELKKMNPTKILNLQLSEDVLKQLDLQNEEKGVTPETLRREGSVSSPGRPQPGLSPRRGGPPGPV